MKTGVKFNVYYEDNCILWESSNVDCTVQCTLYTVLCTLYTVQCTVYTVQCTPVYNI